MRTIIEMAREAGSIHSEMIKTLEAFAELIRAEAQAEEREACAKVCETLGVHPAVNVWNGGPDWYRHGKDCADAIRARGNT